jgi:excisionase family DNA binding protein
MSTPDPAPSSPPDVLQSPTFVSVKELALLLNVHHHTIYMMVERGLIPFLKVGNQYRFDPARVVRALTREKTSPESDTPDAR